MAFGSGTVADFGGAVSDLFAVSAYRSKAQGDLMGAANYDLAAKYADQEAAYTKESTAIQEMQAQRELYKSMGQTKADVAGAGFAASGSALDMLRESASQGALQQAVLQRQGLITEQGYEEQAESYRNMEAAAQMAAQAEKKAAVGAEWTAGLKFATGLASMFTGGGITSLLGGGSDSGGGGEPMSLAPPPPQQFGPFPEPTGLRGVY
jgi:hypothetical protein